ncbi:MAG: thiamine pyrophosphate-dependent dehydrogenase E1 component subunit alpha [Anaerolineaceae bacterium]|nr:thiamine pyrophosphate-dependent dehydrogenase E1 component subunit alpha [Anaerolineaceae bacterium]
MIIESKQEKLTPYTGPADKKFKERVRELGLSNADLLTMYRHMCETRAFERMADKLYQLGKVHGTMHLSVGQEAVAAGTAFAVDSKDYLINHHRGHGHFISWGADINLMMAEFLGKENGYCKGRGGSMHIADVENRNLGANGIVGGGIPLTVGVGLSLQLDKSKQMVVGIFGDGASNEGVFHESLNMAALWNLPILFICENNHYGMSMSVERSTAKLPIAQRAEAYGMPYAYIDGNDTLAVYEVMKDASDRIHNGSGPILVEAVTYRWFGHSKSDRNLYRTKEEIDEWKARDPLEKYKTLLISEKIITAKKAQEIYTTAEKIIDDAVEFADASPEPDISTLKDWIYA